MKDKDKEADELTESDIWDCTEIAGEVQAEYGEKITGAIGDFVDLYKNSILDLKKAKNKEMGKSLKAYTRRSGKKAWDAELNMLIETYISDCIQERKREVKYTYQRHNRRQGIVKPGDPIKKGTLPKKDKMDITLTYYIDKSGSMSGGKLENAFKASHLFSKALLKNNEDEAIINDFNFTYYAFDEHFHEMKQNQIPRPSNGNVDFNEILEYIHEHSLNDMINIIITDAQFPINPKKCIEAIKQTQGLFIVVANSSYNQVDFEEIEKTLKGKFKFLLADNDFTFNSSHIK